MNIETIYEEDEELLRKQEIRREKRYYVNYTKQKVILNIKIALIAIVLIIACCYISLFNTKCNYIINSEDNTITITDCYSTAFIVDFPKEIDGYKVTKIELDNSKASFNKKCPFAIQIKISDGITDIGANSFSNSNIRYLNLPNSIEHIEYRAFFECSKLKKITVNKGDYVTIKDNAKGYLGAYSFANCTNLKEIDINNNIAKISESAFTNCTSIKNIQLPESIAIIEKNAFKNCESLTFIKTPANMESIGVGAFINCKSLRQIYIPSGVTKIEDYCFTNCKYLNDVQLSDTINAIGEFAFSACDSLDYIYLSGNVTDISEYAFKDTISLRPSTIVILTPKGSEGEEYAKKNNISCQN